MKRTADTTAADDLLAPVRAWVHGNHGATTRLAAKVSELADGEIHRQTLGRWLHEDPAKRNQPTLGLGLLLVQAYEALAAPE